MDFTGKQDIIKNVQQSLKLQADGHDGPATWQAIEKLLVKIPAAPQVKESVIPNTTTSKSGNFVQKLLTLARAEVGVEEINGTNCSARVNQYKAATTLDSTQSWPWCAAFVCWLFKEAMSGTTYSFKRPTTAGAFDFENWAANQDKSIQTKKPHHGDIVAGDIVIFTFSHIGLAISSPNSNGMVTTIEGNTDAAGSREGGGVYIKSRSVSKIRSRIRVCV